MMFLEHFVVNRPSEFLSSSRAQASFLDIRCLDFRFFICYCFSIGASYDFSLGKFLL